MAPSSDSKAKPSSSTTGFFQESPRIPNQFHDDVAVHRAFHLFTPENLKSRIAADLTKFSARILSPQVLRWIADAEQHPPYLRTWNTWGKRQDELVTSEGWRNLQELGIKEGVVSLGYDATYAPSQRQYQFLKLHLWGGSSAEVTCPSAMQDGAAALLRKHVQSSSETAEETKAILASALHRLLSRDPEYAWTSGQWMTERPGGSDVRNTETRAKFTPDIPSTFPNCASDGSALGPWSIDGFKWFSSATDANMSILLAKTGLSDDISAFFAPTRRRRQNIVTSTSENDEEQTEFNGIQVQRLKNKLGTKALPTAELVLDGMRAHLLGKVGQGTKEISTVLNITRIHTAVGAVSGWGRGLAISRAFAKVREASGHLLMEIPAHVKGLAAQHVDYRAYTLFTHRIAAALGASESKFYEEVVPVDRKLSADEHAHVSRILRIVTPVLKATTSLAAIAGLRFCMESLGGVGYLENEDPELNIARLYRDANVLSIWEGTTDVLAADFVRVLKGADGAAVCESLRWWIAHKGYPECLRESLDDVIHMVEGRSAHELRYFGRELMDTVAWILCGATLVLDAQRDDDPVAHEVANRWLAKADQDTRRKIDSRDWWEQAAWDKVIVFGGLGEESTDGAAKL